MTAAVERKAPVEAARQAGEHRLQRMEKRRNRKRHVLVAGGILAVVLAVAIGMHKASQVRGQ
jgi:hypothetical protein